MKNKWGEPTYPFNIRLPISVHAKYKKLSPLAQEYLKMIIVRILEEGKLEQINELSVLNMNLNININKNEVRPEISVSTDPELTREYISALKDELRRAKEVIRRKNERVKELESRVKELSAKLEELSNAESAALALRQQLEACRAEGIKEGIAKAKQAVYDLVKQGVIAREAGFRILDALGGVKQ